MHHLFIDRCRKLSRRPPHDAIEGESVPEEVIEPEPPWASLSIEDVRAALAELDASFRRVYELHVFEKYSYDQIAADLGIQKATVGTRLNRARHKLREILCRMGGVRKEDA
jgi:RNA polymerase sigma-70 factor (ECF subfamily)